MKLGETKEVDSTPIEVGCIIAECKPLDITPEPIESENIYETFEGKEE